MRLTNAQFLELACRWAYDHHTTLIDEERFLPEIGSKGISDSTIERSKRELERDGVIKNLLVIGGIRDFELSPGVFRQYLSRTLPSKTLAKARSLYEHWNRSPTGSPFGIATLVEQLGVSEVEASYYLTAILGE